MKPDARFTIVGQSDQACGKQSTTSLVGRYSTTSTVGNLLKHALQENIPQQAQWETFYNKLSRYYVQSTFEANLYFLLIFFQKLYDFEGCVVSIPSECCLGYAMCPLGIMQHGFLYIETQNQWYMTDRGISYTTGLQKSGTDKESI